MAEVFVSYKRNDETRVEQLVRVLEAHGVSVWWDRALEHGADFGDIIDREIDNAGAVIVCWSGASTTREEGKANWVRAEAQRAHDRGKYVGAALDDCLLPSPFNSLNAVDLRNWTGAADDRRLLALLRDIGRRIGRTDIAGLAEAEDKRLDAEERRRRAAAEAERVRREEERQRAEAEAIAAAAKEKEALLREANRENDRRLAAINTYVFATPVALLVLWTSYHWPLLYLWFSDIGDPLSMIGFVVLQLLMGIPSAPSWFLGLWGLGLAPARRAFSVLPIAFVLGVGGALPVFGAYLMAFPPADQSRASNPIEALLANRRGIEDRVAFTVCERSFDRIRRALEQDPDAALDDIDAGAGFRVMDCIERQPGRIEEHRNWARQQAAQREN